MLKKAHFQHYLNSKHISHVAGGLNPIPSFLEYYHILSKYMNTGKPEKGYSPRDLKEQNEQMQDFILGAPRLNSQLVLYYELDYDIIGDKIKNIIKASNELPTTKKTVVEMEIPPEFPLFYLGAIFEDTLQEEYLLPYGIRIEFIEKSTERHRIRLLKID